MLKLISSILSNLQSLGGCLHFFFFFFCPFSRKQKPCFFLKPYKPSPVSSETLIIQIGRSPETLYMGIFEPYRALGYITGPVPFSVQRLGTETFVTVSVGKAFQIYDVSPLSPSFDSLWAFFYEFCGK